MKLFRANNYANALVAALALLADTTGSRANGRSEPADYLVCRIFERAGHANVPKAASAVRRWPAHALYDLLLGGRRW